MRTALLLLVSLGMLLTTSCSTGSSSPIGPIDLTDHHAAGPPCPDPGPAPGAPTLLQMGTLSNRRRVQVAHFDFVSGPELWTNPEGCEQWAFNAHLTVTVNGEERHFTKVGYYGSISGTVVLTEDATPDCNRPTGAFTFVGSGSGVWYYRTRGCGGAGPSARLQGTWTSP
ncbi:MAG: hypothetical protein ABI743_07830 [bacterium]